MPRLEPKQQQEQQWLGHSMLWMLPPWMLVQWTGTMEKKRGSVERAVQVAAEAATDSRKTIAKTPTRWRPYQCRWQGIPAVEHKGLYYLAVSFQAAVTLASKMAATAVVDLLGVAVIVATVERPVRGEQHLAGLPATGREDVAVQQQQDLCSGVIEATWG